MIREGDDITIMIHRTQELEDPKKDGKISPYIIVNFCGRGFKVIYLFIFYFLLE